MVIFQPLTLSRTGQGASAVLFGWKVNCRPGIIADSVAYPSISSIASECKTAHHLCASWSVISFYLYLLSGQAICLSRGLKACSHQCSKVNSKLHLLLLRSVYGSALVRSRVGGVGGTVLRKWCDRSDAVLRALVGRSAECTAVAEWNCIWDEEDDAKPFVAAGTLAVPTGTDSI